MSGCDGHLLTVEGLSVRAGISLVLDGVSLRIRAGQVVGLIGPNGAGKTTFIDAVTGFVEPDAGRLDLAGVPLDGLAPHQRSRLGLSRTFQSLDLFEGLTVREHLEVSATAQPPAHRVARRLRRRSGADRAAPRGVDDTLALLGLTAVAEVRPPGLSPVHRRCLALGRALVSGPRLLILDEPAPGLDRCESQRLVEVIRELPGRGTTVLLSDHDMPFVMEVCDTVHVLHRGRTIAAGTPAEVTTDPAVVEAYLGGPP